MPNTTVLAAAEGMPEINRRRMLLGLAAASTAAAAITVASAAGCAPAEHPDAVLFRLDQEMEVAYSQMNRAAKVCKRVGRKCEKLYPPRPPKWEEPDMPEDVRVAFQAMTVKDMGTINRPAIYAAWSNEVKEQKAANNGLQQAYHAKWQEINRESGLDAAEDAFGVRVSEVDEFAKRICSIPAHTFEGMAVKLRAHVRTGGEIEKAEMYLDDYAFASIAADIRRLAGEA
ncbi:hypothetical protein [Mesorhizobium sp.]|uniref:hypothetical protein n=1 Tax=Mesorhizobium sp. TaxID=1871066 RepID=UPI000FE9CC33|nr:hypothetical protein [Mesorhizobium sp.]RWK54300.1 MAG: hypothetical protein EOR48_18030 [Mesorhizobium sp.]TIP42661.1 MAG: hypothetical protein E5X62_21475 [Mesorhizobium sp.]